MKTLSVGDKVTWTHTSSNGHSFRFSTREGKIIVVEGDIATIKMRNGRLTSEPVSHLRAEGEETALTEAFKAALTEVCEQAADQIDKTPEAE